MSGFTLSWLDLREPADRNARVQTLSEKALVWLDETDATADALLVLDIGSGSGSTLRALTDLVAKKISWRLVDYDGELLQEATRRHGEHITIETYQIDLTHAEKLPLDGVKLVTASALFDLTSRDFIGQLVTRLSQQQAALYAALNYDGITEWTPTHPLDAAVLNAFNQHQRGDKGFGPALGPDAAIYLKHALETQGYRVVVGASPWQLQGQDAELVRELITGIAHAVAQTKGLTAEDLSVWQEFRLNQIHNGTCRVGHMDLLALPL